jgi:imidazolonepropionase
VATLLITNIAELTTHDPTHGDETPMGRLHDAALVVDETRVLWVGSSAQAPACDEAIDAEGAAVVPGFVDSHTHLVSAGERSSEFEARMAGTPYDGGGIANTVEATREATRFELRTQTAQRARKLHAGGVTTMEIKSGYELTLSGEERLLEIAREFTDEVTFLGAHVVPREFASDRRAYVELVIDQMLAHCAPRALWADVFCEQGAFSVDESRQILVEARRMGLGPRVHGNQVGGYGRGSARR